MKYDGSGKYLGADLHERDGVPHFRAYRDTAMAHAVPFTDWWAEFGERTDQ